jgi:hypothetical protein
LTYLPVVGTTDDPHPATVHPPCEVCHAPIYLADEVGWARITTRAKVRSDPDDYIDAEIVVHTACVADLRLVADLVGS